MDFMTAVNTCLKLKYANFNDRASRSEYWWFVLFSSLCGVAAIIVGAILASIFSSPQSEAFVAIMLIPYFILALGLIVPTIAAVVRRLHDIDMSGWWYLGFTALSAIPFVGFIASIVLLVFLCKSGTPGPNRFGPNPFDKHNYQQTFQ